MVATPGSSNEQVSRIEALEKSGASAVGLLIDELTEPRWSVRRLVVSALARQGDAAVAALRDVLRSRRDSETRIAATVDALVLSRGDVESVLFDLAEKATPAVLCDIAQILGRRRSAPGVPLLTQLTQHPDDNVAVAAIEALGHVGGRAAVSGLIAAAASGNFFRTFPAIDVLGRIGASEAVPTLLTLLEQPFYAVEAARALGRTGDDRAIGPLVRLLLKPADTLLRAASSALVAIHSTWVRRGMSHVVPDALLAAPLPSNLGRRLASCVEGADAPERVALCKVLGWVGGEESIGGLLTLLHEDADVASAAAEALATIGRDAELRMRASIRDGDSDQRLAVLPHLRRRSSAVADVLCCLEDAEPLVRVRACETLASIGDVSAVPALFRLLGDTDAKVAQAALAAIQSLGSPRTEALALEAARHPDVKVRRLALRIIAYFGYPSGLEPLLAAMNEEDERLRDVAIYGLPFLEDPRAVEALLGAATHTSARTRAAAMRALGQGPKGPAITARLREGLADEDAWVRYYAVQSLGKQPDPDTAASIIALLDDPAGQVRVAVVDALAQVNSPEAFQALCETARSKDPDVQRAALLALGVTRRVEALPLLLSAVNASDPATRLVALSAVSGFDAPMVEATLAGATRDPDASVRNAAVGFLAARTGNSATQQLIALLGDQPLRELALESLAIPVEGRIQAILSGLQTADDDLAPFLVGALSRMKRPDASAAILEALRIAAPAGRRAAAQTISTWGTPAGRAALERAAREDEDPDVRRACALVLVP